MSKQHEKPKRGRPPVSGEEALMEPITIRFPQEMMRRINKIREQRLDQPDKSTIVRELVAKGLGV